MKFGGDASLRDEDSLRDVWYRHEEITGKMEINYHGQERDQLAEQGVEKFCLRRRMKFIGNRLDLYFKSLPEGGYPEEMQAYIAQVISGEAELTEELEKVYNAVAMPTKEVMLQKQEEAKQKEEKSLALPKAQKEEKKRASSTNKKRSTSRGKIARSPRK